MEKSIYKQPKRLLGTGFAGFIGHHTVEHVLKNTDWEIVIMDRLTYSGNLNFLTDLDIWEAERHRVKFVYHDFRAPISETTKMLIGDIDYIIHMGAESHVDRSIEDPMPFAESNVIGTINMLNYAKEIKPEKFIYISTDEVYGPAHYEESNNFKKGISKTPTKLHLHKEGEPHFPSNPYSASKSGAEAFCYAYWNTYGIPVIITNCFDMETKLITPDGVKGFDDINEGDLVWSYDKGKLVSTEVIEKVKMPSSGEMVSIQKEKINQVVTPNHRMFVKTRHGKPAKMSELKEVLANELKDMARCYVPLTAEWEGDKPESRYDFDTKILMSLYGWYVSEGFELPGNGVAFAAGSKEQQDEIIDLLSIIGVKGRVNGRSVRCYNKELKELMVESGKYAENKIVPKYVREADKEHIRIFYDAVIKGDGNINKRGNATVYYTKSLKLAEQMLEIGMKIGYSVRLSERYTWNPFKTKKSKSYIVRFRLDTACVEREEVKTIKYDGDVWCVRTKLGKVFVVRDGIVSLSGQTMNNFGERQNAEKFLPIVMNAAINDAPLTLHCKKSEAGEIVDISSRCWLHARNHADGILFLLEHGISGEHYNITGEWGSVKDIADKVASIVGKPINYVFEDFHSFRPGHDMHYGLDGTKMKELGWNPPFNLDESLERTVKWTMEHPIWLETK